MSCAALKSQAVPRDQKKREGESVIAGEGKVMAKYRFISVLSVIVLLVTGSGLASNHPFSVRDMLAMDRIGEPTPSPDGSQVVFSVRATDLGANRGVTNLWLVNSGGSGLRQLTNNQASDFNPRWTADGAAVLFLSTRSGSSQIWKIPVTGGEAVQVTDFPLSIGTFFTVPGSDGFVVTFEVYPDCETIDCTVKRLEERDASKVTGVVYDELFVRHWDTWKDGRRSHVFSVSSAKGQPIDLMKGLNADSPSKPFGGAEEITVTPDGKHVVFTARMGGSQEAWSTDFDLYSVPIDGSSAPRCLTEGNEAWDTSPVFSPDGKMMAYTAMKRPGFEADRFRIVLMDWTSGTQRVLTEDWDRSASSLFWASDGSQIFATAANLGQNSLFSVDVKTGQVMTLVESGTVGSPSLAGDRILFGLDTLGSPTELFTVGLDGSGMKAITRINEAKVAAAGMGEYEQFTFPGWNDETVYAYVVKPADFDPSKKYPVAFLIHGGPQGSFGNHFHYRWNPQAYAGAGYAAVMVDFHGSTGYGQGFTDSISGDWGGKPLVDLQKGLAAALARYSWMDGERVGALGASYGGYMINWIAGNWPDRFRCLVNHDGLFDMRGMYYATEELWFPEWEQGGKPYWQDPASHEKFNPASHVEKWVAPMLVVHGALDYRVNLEQGLATFTALQRKGVPSRFLFFPDENHFVLKPHNSIQWHETVIGWLDKWLK